MAGPVRPTTPPLGQVDPPLRQVDPPLGQVDPPLGQADPPLGQADPPLGQVDPPLGQVDPPLGQADPPHGQADPPHGRSIRHSGRSIRHTGRSIRHTGRSIRHSGRSIRHSGRPIRHSGRPIRHSGRPIRHTGRSIRHTGRSTRHSGRSIARRYSAGAVAILPTRGATFRGHDAIFGLPSGLGCPLALVLALTSDPATAAAGRSAAPVPAQRRLRLKTCEERRHGVDNVVMAFERPASRAERWARGTTLAGLRHARSSRRGGFQFLVPLPYMGEDGARPAHHPCHTWGPPPRAFAATGPAWQVWTHAGRGSVPELGGVVDGWHRRRAWRVT